VDSPLFLRANRTGEHFLYLALLGVVLAGIPFVGRFYRRLKGSVLRQVLIWGVAGFFIFYFSSLTYQQNKIWREPETFYENILQHVPESWTALNNLGTLLEKEGEEHRAERLLKKAIALKPHRPESHSNLGTLYLKRGDLDDAVREYQVALALWPMSAPLHNNLASAYRLKGALEESVSFYQKALHLNPDLVESRYFLADTYTTMGKTELAQEQYRYLEEQGIRVELED